MSKFHVRSKPCLFLGSSDRHKGFKCLDPETNRVLISRHVKFVEDFFPYWIMFPSAEQSSPLQIFLSNPVNRTLGPLSSPPNTICSQTPIPFNFSSKSIPNKSHFQSTPSKLPLFPPGLLGRNQSATRDPWQLRSQNSSYNQYIVGRHSFQNSLTISDSDK